MKHSCKDRMAVVELEEALADYLDYGMADGGHNLFSDILPRICSLEQAGEILSRHADELTGCAQNLKGRLRIPVAQDIAKPKTTEKKYIAISGFETALMVVMAFFFSLCMLQHFYPLG